MIQPPNFAKDAVPTPRGWANPKTGELLVSRKIKQSDIDAFFGSWVEETKNDEPVFLVEDDIAEIEVIDAPVFTSMTKAQLLTYADEIGMDIDPSITKREIIAILQR